METSFIDKTRENFITANLVYFYYYYAYFM